MIWGAMTLGGYRCDADFYLVGRKYSSADVYLVGRNYSSVVAIVAKGSAH